MKQFMKLSILSSLLISTSTFALNPVQGFYLGLLGEISHGLSQQEITFSHDGAIFSGVQHYSPVGGGGGVALGYKISHFRLEAEVLYNRISTGPLDVNACRLQSPTVPTPTGVCPADLDNFQKFQTGFNGSNAALYGLFNAYYDFFSSDSENALVPYIGLGIGRASVRSNINFVNTVSGATMLSSGSNFSQTVGAAQGIIGLSYYMDDFAWVGMDYRYVATQTAPLLFNTRYNYSTLNFNVNLAFDWGAIDFSS